MNKDEIKQVASIALGHVNTVLGHWVPGGKREGDEYLPLNPKRADSKPGSFSINVKTGAWSDFATGDKGGDSVGLVAYLEDVPQGEAAKMLANFLGINVDKESPPICSKSTKNSAVNGWGDSDGWVCVTSIPDDAPEPPVCHYRHGTPTHRYAYHSIEGAVCVYHDRYELGGGKRKQFAPLTLWKKDGCFEWRFKAPQGLRSLYGLPSLIQHPDVPVWLVEGEKAAAALSQLHPHHPVLTWQGGAQAVTKSDYTVLSQRDCVIFRDNDDPGLKAQQSLIKQLQAAGVASIQVLAVDQLALKPGWSGENDARKATLSAGEPFMSGGDAADLLTSGWQVEHFALYLERDGVLLNVDLAEIKSETSTDKKELGKQQTRVTQRRFELLGDGVYLLEPGRDGNWNQRRICAWLEVLGRVRDVDNRGWGKLLKFRDFDNREKIIFIPMRDFGGEGIGIRSQLLDEGLDIAPRCGRDVLDYLLSVDSEERVRAAHRAGWHGTGDQLAFVYDDSFIGGGGEKWVNIYRPEDKLFTRHGRLTQWREKVGALCAGNNRLMLAVSAALAAPLLHIVGEESGGIHFRGGSSSGKTTVLRVGASVVGGANYMTQWNASGTAVENLAESRCDAPLILDELKQVDPKMAEDISYMVGNGTGKSRGRPERGNRPLARWRVVVMSSGEISLAQHVAVSGKSINAGAEIRLCDIPVDAGAGMGAFENIHEHESPGAFANALAANAAKYYGTAFPEFITRVLDNQGYVTSQFRDFQNRFFKSVLKKDASGQARRIASRFALFAWAGELATSWDITGWHSGEALKAAEDCFSSCIESFGGQGNKEHRQMLKKVRRYLQENGEAKFSNLNRSIAQNPHVVRTAGKIGYREKVGGNSKSDHEDDKDGDDFDYGLFNYLCYQDLFHEVVCQGLDPNQAIKLLKALGHLETNEGGRSTYKTMLPGEGRVRVYCIKPSIFWGDDD